MRLMIFVQYSVICEIGQSASSANASTYMVADFNISACIYPQPSLFEIIFVLIILFIPMFTLALILERLVAHHKIAKQIKAFMADEGAAAQKFLSISSSEKVQRKPCNHLFEIIAHAFGENASQCANQPRPRIQIEQARQRTVALKRNELEARLWVISAIAVTMPLFSLFGSFINLSETFFYTEYYEEISMWTLLKAAKNTVEILAWGLGTAIPTFWIYKLLMSRAKTLSLKLDNASARLLDLVMNFHSRPWLLESQSNLDMRTTQSFARSTADLNLNRQS